MTIRVEVAYATPERQRLVELDMDEGATVAQAVEAANLAAEFDGFEVDDSRVGIFSRKVGLDHVLREGDRVEVYRPLLVEPKEARRQRAALQSKN